MFRKIQDQFRQVSKAICASINQILLPAIEIKFNEQPMIFENKQWRGGEERKDNYIYIHKNFIYPTVLLKH